MKNRNTYAQKAGSAVLAAAAALLMANTALADAKAFKLKEGLSWIDSSGRNWNVTDLKEWLGERAQAGRLPPKGFPKSNRFG